MNQVPREMRTRKQEQTRLNQIARRARAAYYEPINFVHGEFTSQYRSMIKADREQSAYKKDTKRLGEALPAENYAGIALVMDITREK